MCLLSYYCFIQPSSLTLLSCFTLASCLTKSTCFTNRFCYYFSIVFHYRKMLFFSLMLHFVLLYHLHILIVFIYYTYCNFSIPLSMFFNGFAGLTSIYGTNTFLGSLASDTTVSPTCSGSNFQLSSVPWSLFLMEPSER